MAGRMIRKQVYLTPEQNERLRARAARERRPEAEILREALDEHFGPSIAKASAIPDDALLGIVGIGKSIERDLSDRIDDLLYGKRGT
jgi:predicted flap endonuclease-1-like 5' DNA nuclease